MRWTTIVHIESVDLTNMGMIVKQEAANPVDIDRPGFFRDMETLSGLLPNSSTQAKYIYMALV